MGEVKFMQHKTVISLKNIFQKSQWMMLCLSGILLLGVLFATTFFSMKNHAYDTVNQVGDLLKERLEPAVVFREDGYLAEELSQIANSIWIKHIRVYDEHHRLLLELQRTERPYGQLQSMADKILYDEALLFEFHDRSELQRVAGYLEIYPSSQYILTFVLQILLGLVIVFIALILCWLYTAHKVYKQMMSVLTPVTQVATLIQDNRAYNLRFPKTHIKEFDVLIETFNQILSETEKWSSNITEENEKLSYKAYHDELTGLANRHVFHQHLQRVYSDPMLRQNSAVIFVDCNRFKKINDTYGHQAGDAVLQAAADRLRSRVRSHDLIARLGGDEFAIILYSIHKVEYLSSIAQHIMAGSEQPIVFDGEEIHFGFSMGIAFSAYADTPDIWVEQADKAMYHAKFLDQHWAIYKPQMGDEE